MVTIYTVIKKHFGKGTISYFRRMPWYRVYNLSSLKELLSSFKIEKVEFALKKEGSWHMVSMSEAENIDSNAQGKRYDVKAIATVVARR